MRPRPVILSLTLLVLPSLACGLLSTGSAPERAPDAPADVQEGQSDSPDAAGEDGAEQAPADDGGAYGDDDTGASGEDDNPIQAGPADIPVFDGPRSVLDYADATTRSYQLDAANYDDVGSFYQREMLVNGWEEDISQVAVVSEGAAVLDFARERRAASVTISVPTGTESVMVMALITDR